MLEAPASREQLMQFITAGECHLHDARLYMTQFGNHISMFFDIYSIIHLCILHSAFSGAILVLFCTIPSLCAASSTQAEQW